MKRFLTASFLTSGLFLGVANGAVILSSIDNASSATVINGAGVSGRAMNFVVPAESSYNLTSIELVFNGVADAGVEVPSITVWSNDATSDGTPVGTELHTLTLSGTLVDGINTFTSSGLTLAAGQTYWIVVRNSGNTFTWLTGAAEPTVGTSTSVVWPGPSGGAADPATWAVTASGFQAARINADEVPEPSIALLSSVVLLSLMKRRRI